LGIHWSIGKRLYNTFLVQHRCTVSAAWSGNTVVWLSEILPAKYDFRPINETFFVVSLS